MSEIQAYLSFDPTHDRDMHDIVFAYSKTSAARYRVIGSTALLDTTHGWHSHTRRALDTASLVIVLCGGQTNHSREVNRELRIAQEESIKYVLVAGRADGNKKPSTAKRRDVLYRARTPAELDQLVRDHC